MGWSSSLRFPWPGESLASLAWEKCPGGSRKPFSRRAWRTWERVWKAAWRFALRPVWRRVWRQAWRSAWPKALQRVSPSGRAWMPVSAEPPSWGRQVWPLSGQVPWTMPWQELWHYWTLPVYPKPVVPVRRRKTLFSPRSLLGLACRRLPPEVLPSRRRALPSRFRMTPFSRNWSPFSSYQISVSPLVP